MQAIFQDRFGAGQQLSQLLLNYRNSDAIVIALPRGGVPVAHIIAKELQLELEVFIVRKIGAPGNSEYAIGAISESGVVLLDNQSIASLHITQQEVDKVIQQEELEITRRLHTYRSGKLFLDITDKTVIIVDDGLATGFTARAALQSLKQKGPLDIIFAAPVCAQDTADALEVDTVSVVCVKKTKHFRAVGQFYKDFRAVEDREVKNILESFNK